MHSIRLPQLVTLHWHTVLYLHAMDHKKCTLWKPSQSIWCKLLYSACTALFFILWTPSAFCRQIVSLYAVLYVPYCGPLSSICSSDCSTLYDVLYVTYSVPVHSTCNTYCSSTHYAVLWFTYSGYIFSAWHAEFSIRNAVLEVTYSYSCPLHAPDCPTMYTVLFAV